MANSNPGIAPRLLLACLMITAVTQASPICRHPSNPHWFECDGKAIALITSAEHYGAVLIQSIAVPDWKKMHTSKGDRSPVRLSVSPERLPTSIS